MFTLNCFISMKKQYMTAHMTLSNIVFAKIISLDPFGIRINYSFFDMR